MNLEKWEKAKEIFNSALESKEGQRTAFLHSACGDDQELRTEVETLLASFANAENFIETPAMADALKLVDDHHGEAFAGRRIGHYTLIKEIGQGGMGTVYLATRADDEYKKRVAIKLIKRGMDSDDILRRFRNERQILASLDHPNIAKLLDGGTTDEGLPFFVMEYIEGQPLTNYCDSHRLSTLERLKLFREICAAVQHAHQNLIVHRDLKPSNIVITPEGTPKLLDFGIAKFLNPNLSPQTMAPTATMMRMMTRDYASPEQVRGEPITTASDIYSLGVLLYKLLTGHQPYQFKTPLRQEMERVICESTPERPSTMVARTETIDTADGATTMITPESVSNSRDTQPEKLKRALSGDLDNIILMAMRKEPQRRYASVAEFSEDIRRHLEGLPVLAMKDTFKYRASKFIKRHRVGVAATVLIILTLVGGIIATVIQAGRAERQRERAEKRFNEVRKLANSLLFEISPQIENVPGTTAAREILVKRALEYLDSLAKEVGDDTGLQRELGTAYRKVGDVQVVADKGDFAGALNSFRKALILDEALLLISPKDAEVRHALAQDYEKVGYTLWWTNDTEGALGFYQKALALREPLIVENPQSYEFRERLANLYMFIGDLYNWNGDTQEALQNFHQAMAVLLTLGKEQSTDLRIQKAIATCHRYLGETLPDPTASLQEYDRALAILEPLYAAVPDDVAAQLLLGRVYHQQAETYRKQKDYKPALEKLGKYLALMEAAAKADPRKASVRNNLAVAYSQYGFVLYGSGNFAGASEYAQKAISIQEELLAKDANSGYMDNLAISYEGLGLAQKSLSDYQAALKSYRKSFPLREKNATDSMNLAAQGDLAKLCEATGLLHIDMASAKTVSAQDRLAHWRGARSLYERSREIYRRLHEQNPERADFNKRLEAVDGQLKKCDEAIVQR